MTTQPPNVKNQLLAEIEREWGALITSLERLDAAHMTEIRDPQGWSVKDNIIHLAYWERGVCFYLQGMPRYLGMEIDEDLFRQGDFDKINAVIQQAQRNMSLEEVTALIHYCHRQLLHQIRTKSDADLLKPYTTSEEGEIRTILEMIHDNTAAHFAEHREWISALVG